MSAIEDFGSCRSASSNQTELFQKIIKTDTNIDVSLQKLIDFNIACVETGKKALIETQNNALSKEIKTAVDSSISRMQSENSIYKVLIENKNKTKANDQTDNAILVSIYSDRFFRRDEQESWSRLTASIKKSSQPQPSFFESIDTAGIFTFIIFVGLLYAYASNTLQNKNNDDKKV